MRNNVIAAVAIVGLILAGSYAASRGADSSSDSDSEAEVAASDEITVGEAESNVRKLVELDGQELRNTILTNSEDALVSLQEITPNFIGDEAAVGDFYFVFETKQILYRPSTNRVIHMVAVTRPAEVTDDQPPLTPTSVATTVPETEAEEEAE